MIIIFSLLFFLLIGTAIGYLAWLFGGSPFLWFWFLPGILVVLFIATRFFSGQGWHTVEHVSSQLGFHLLAFAMVLFGFTFLGALMYHVFSIPPRLIASIVLLVSFMFIIIARIHAEKIVVSEVVLPSDKISKEHHFVQLSDIHRGSTGQKHLERIVEKVKTLNPEFVVITGDFIDAEFVTFESITALDQLSMPIFLITGNHEYYLKEGKINEVIAESNIRLIDDTKVTYEELDIIGINELSTIARSVEKVEGIDIDRYTIVLYHQPKTEEAMSASNLGADLMLSGHTHKGQVWPLGLFIQKFQFKYLAGLYSVGDMYLYVNQGTGTWGPKIRLGSVNEITSIRLKIQNHENI